MSADDSLSTIPSKRRVLVTGSTGYIGKHVILQLLNAGHFVKASMRSSHHQKDELWNAIRPHLTIDPKEAQDRLSIVELDLTSNDGWHHAMMDDDGAKIDVLMHLASPCPPNEPENEADVIQPAVDGVLRAVRAARAANVTRVICTSSVAAIVNAAHKKPMNEATTTAKDGVAKTTTTTFLYNEKDWSDCTKPGLSAYVKSKTLAEKALWEWHKQEAPEMEITTILPSFVLGAPLDDHYGPSVRKIEHLLFPKNNRQSLLPNYGYSCVDVRDIALMHVRAMERPRQSIGKRFICSARCFMWVPEMAQILSKTYPDLDMPNEMPPNKVVYEQAKGDPSLRYVLVNLDKRRELDNTASCQCMGLQFRSVHTSLLETAEYLMERHGHHRGHVKNQPPTTFVSLSS